jgi:hypothetical protein
MTTPGSWRGMANEYHKLPDEIQRYYEHFPSLCESYPWDVVIAYLFSRVELAQNMTIYCGVVKCHRVDSEIAKKAVNNQHMTRQGFKDLYKSIFGKAIPSAIASKLDHAEDTRDKILHGKPVSEADKRKAVYDLILYAKEFNDKLQDLAGFKPFDSLQGYKGRAQSLDKATSRWVVKGMGFTEFQ